MIINNHTQLTETAILEKDQKFPHAAESLNVAALLQRVALMVTQQGVCLPYSQAKTLNEKHIIV